VKQTVVENERDPVLVMGDADGCWKECDRPVRLIRGDQPCQRCGRNSRCYVFPSLLFIWKTLWQLGGDCELYLGTKRGGTVSNLPFGYTRGQTVRTGSLSIISRTQFPSRFSVQGSYAGDPTGSPTEHGKSAGLARNSCRWNKQTKTYRAKAFTFPLRPAL
jgi:hypothetical protein